MGCYSWMYCDTKERMICGKRKDSFLLIPAEFGGGHVIEHCYGGYGKMGTVDIYEVAAWWNKKYLTTDMIEVPSRSSWDNAEEGQKWYERAMATYKYECQRLQDFVDDHDEEYMVKNYGSDWQREIGINIACYDENNKKLQYPIKIAEKPDSVYESCEYSKLDPMQGCY